MRARCGVSVTFTVKGDSDAITFTCEKAAGHGRGRQTIHRAGWGLFAQVEWLDSDTVTRIFAEQHHKGLDSSSRTCGIRSRHENRE